MKDFFAVGIGERIKSMREKLGIGQKELAEKIGVTPSAVNQYEKGEKRPSSIILARVAEALDISADYLLGASENENTFISREEVSAFQHFKVLNKRDRESILGHMDYLRAKSKKL